MTPSAVAAASPAARNMYLRPGQDNLRFKPPSARPDDWPAGLSPPLPGDAPEGPAETVKEYAPLINWWNMMETTFGAVFGAILALGLWLNRRLVARDRPDGQVVLLPEVEVGRHCDIRRAVIDRGCRIPPGTVIGKDAAADAERFRVTPKGIVLVTAKMLGQQNTASQA